MHSFPISLKWGHFDLCSTLHIYFHRANQGRLLDYIVQWENLTEGKIKLYLGEILEAVQYLHNCRIVHLDLKVNWITISSPPDIFSTSPFAAEPLLQRIYRASVAR